MDLDPYFVETIENLQDEAGDQVESAGNYFGGVSLEDYLPRWQLVENPNWSGDILDPSAIGALFERTLAGTAYLGILTAGGKEGYLSALKVQSDILASTEQAFRMRHKGKMRCTVHALATRRGHAQSGYGTLQRMIAGVSSWILAADTPSEGDGT